ncbi:MAG TPA: hypothetical protein VGS19_34780 [Streptosporangiaceae bacterium]|nr:hypothetical protein [Streptosporangiaceae bacterium]
MRVPSARVRLTTAAAAVVVAGGLSSTAMTYHGSGSPTPASGSSVVKASVFTPQLKEIGQVNLSALAKSQHLTQVTRHLQGARLSRAEIRAAASRFREADNAILSHRPKGTAGGAPDAATTALSTQNVKGEFGFSALGGVQQASTTGGVDLEPPDQGLCAGGGYVMEFVNNALAIYDAHGSQLLAPTAATAAFLQPSTAFMSDPRCYYDAPTKRWFYQEFIVGTVSSSGQVLTPSTQFEAVSNTADPTGSYTVFSWDTTDVGRANCPCFGDYDNLGADGNGIYVTTNEFGLVSGFNGVVMYAVSKQQLETAAATGILPVVFAYRIPSDALGQAYLIAPTSTPPGAKFAPNTEYFVESDSNLNADRYLMVYALHNTAQLGTPAPPKLQRTEIASESYAFPPDATQEPGLRPLGTAYQDPAGGLQADFNAEMEPTYVGGQVYAELDTATASGNDAVDWFIIQPKWTDGVLTAAVAHQGRVAVKGASLLYPYTAVDSSGVGYLLFSLSGPHNYPSPAYVTYNTLGPTGPVIEATQGAVPEDSFTCYAAFVGPNYGGCRWGDYSMGAVSNGRVFMATEMVPQGYRDTLTNWGTYVWSAPPPPVAP